MATGWTQGISGYTSSWAVGATIYSPVYVTQAGSTASWTVYENGIPVSAAPVNTVPPVVSGLAQEYQVLSCDGGTWTSLAAYTLAYQWYRNGVAIVGETGTTYTTTTTDYLKTITCKVTATNNGGSTTATSNGKGPIAEAAPINTLLPATSGTSMVGAVLSTTNGTWISETTPTYQYLWIRETGGAGTPINGATSSTYTVQVADIGYKLHCQVTATNTTGSAGAQGTSSSTVFDSAPVNTVAPVAAGRVYAGTLLTCTSGTWTSNTSLTYAYQWKRNGSNISSATSANYTCVTADEGQSITCTVTASNTGNYASATSNTLSDWVPSSLTPTLWIDMGDISTITKDGSNNITQVNDKSGNGRNFTQTSTRCPVYYANQYGASLQYGTARYDGVNDRLEGSLGSNLTSFTVAIVTKVSRVRQYDAFFDSAAATNDLTCEQSDLGRIDFWQYGVGRNAISVGTIGTSNIYDLMWSYSGTTLGTSVNNAGAGYGPSSTGVLKSAVAIGGDRGTGGFFYTQGDIMEVLVFPSVLSSASSGATLHQYFKNKWNF